jgi:hypothetical protein
MKVITDSSLIDLIIPLQALNFSILVHDQSKMSMFDCFDRVNPEYLIISSKSLTGACVKNISERPHLKTIIVADSFESNELEQLESKVGKSFYLFDRPEYYNPIAHKNSRKSEFFNSTIVCLEGDDIKDIDSYYPSKNVIYRIFSDKRVINNNHYCGLLPNELKSVALKSSRISITTKQNRLNSIYCGSIPVLKANDAEKYLDIKDLDSVLLDMKKELENNSNFHALARMFNSIGESKISEFLLKSSENFI